MLKFRDDKKILIASLLAAFALWVLDAFIDTYVFEGDETFWASLLGRVSSHELYFRVFFILSLVVFGFFASRFITQRRQAEEKARELADAAEEERTRSAAVLQAIADGISIHSRDYRILYQNEVSKQLMGDHQGTFCYAAYHKRAAICENCPVAETFRDGGTHVLEKVVRGEQGPRHIEIYTSPLRNSKGEIVAGIEAVRDITDRKRLEAEVRDQKRFAEGVIENSAVATFVLSPTHTVLLWNKACEELTGIPAAEMIGTNDHWKPFYREQRQTLADVVIDQDLDVLPDLYSSYSCSTMVRGGLQAEGWYRNLNGQDRYIVFNAVPLYSGKGELSVVIETLHDITERRKAEDALRESQSKYKNLVELTTDIIYRSDRNGNQVYMNDAAYQTLGYAPEEVIGRPFFELIHPDDREKTRQKRQEMVERKIDVFNFENRYVTRDGRTLSMLHNVRVLRDETGEIIGTQGIARDITEWKQAQDKLRLFSEAIEEAMDGVQIVDLAGRILYSNRAMEEIYGFSAAEFLGKHVNDMNADPLVAVTVILPALQQAGRWSGELMVKHKDGHAFPVWLSSSIVRNEKGDPIAMVGIIRDITERKRAENALQKMNAQLQALIHAIPDMVMFKDADGRHLLVNKAVEELTGHPSSEIIGKAAEELLPPDAAAACRRSDQEAMTLRKAIQVEEPLVNKHGEERYIDFVKAPIVDDAQKTIGLVSIGRDVTERKGIELELRAHREHLEELVRERTRELLVSNERLEQEMAERQRMEDELIRAQKLESLSLLAGGIAHDFNNLLASIMGTVSLAMLDLPPDGPVYQQLAGAERASLRARELTQQLLTFSKGGAPVKMYGSLEEVVRDTAGFSLRGSRTGLAFSFPGDFWPVEADLGQLSQVVNNLIINADQAMPNGGSITITGENILLGPVDLPPLPEGRYVRITVQDQGIGIPKEYLSKIFDPYFTTKQKGSGLGLAITYSIIRKHGGFITVESKAGAGASFSVYLPAAEDRRDVPRARKDVPLTGSGRILVMDDEPDVRKTTGDILTRLGYTVVFAEEGGTALELYRQARESGTPFDLTIMDLTVPGGMGGKDAITKLLEIDPAAKVIVSSGYSQDPVMAEYASFGFKDIVMKPFRVKELGEAVQRVLSGDPA